MPDYANLDELKAHYQRGGLGDVKVKKFLNNVLQETLEPIRNRREELEKDPGYVMDVLRQGTEAAQAAAAVRCLHTAFELDSDSVFEETQLSAEEIAAKMNKGR